MIEIINRYLNYGKVCLVQDNTIDFCKKKNYHLTAKKSLRTCNGVIIVPPENVELLELLTIYYNKNNTMFIILLLLYYIK